MFRQLKCSKNTVVPYLTGSKLMQLHPEGVTFSTTKPNAIVGPNGSGKSALLKALAIHSLSWLTGTSGLNDGYTDKLSRMDIWTERRWRDYEFMAGITVDSDDGAAAYFRPNAIPGDETSLTHAMMCGYSKEAKRVGELTDEKSSGEANRAMQGDIQSFLSGKKVPKWTSANWTEPRCTVKEMRGYVGVWDIAREKLTERVKAISKTAIPVVMMDEPEQALDARAELQLWKAITSANMTKLQVIVATHSLYPIMHSDQFHIIEAEPGYVQSVLELM
ncbi:hypothetical protein [Comamonas thiooxydans]|uniref:hypothetical protein n=1 Tax=Comamonas thiooxydans TaxID=363952 RepID=UPI001186E8DC|nr:hypothetical protein [Comamonas thiooxydans]